MAKTTTNTLSDDLLAQFRAYEQRIAALERDKRDSRDDFRQMAQAPDDLVARTPAGGIAGRTSSGLACELCDMYAVSGNIGDTAQLVDLERQEYVYNVSSTAVAESIYVATARFKSGHRYVIVESCS